MTSFNILGDGILLSTSVVACFYCILLSRRIRKLASADQGVGKGIADMAAAVERLNASLEQTRVAARNESETLQRQLAEARSLAERTGDLLEDGDHQLKDLAKGLADARRVVAALGGLVEAAGKRRLHAARAAEREIWRPDQSDGLPSDEMPPAFRPVPAAPTTNRRKTATRDDALLLDAMALDQSEGDDGDDPFPDVMPITRRRARRAGQPGHRET